MYIMFVHIDTQIRNTPLITYHVGTLLYFLLAAVCLVLNMIKFCRFLYSLEHYLSVPGITKMLSQVSSLLKAHIFEAEVNCIYAPVFMCVSLLTVLWTVYCTLCCCSDSFSCRHEDPTNLSLHNAHI